MYLQLHLAGDALSNNKHHTSETSSSESTSLHSAIEVCQDESFNSSTERTLTRCSLANRCNFLLERTSTNFATLNTHVDAILFLLAYQCGELFPEENNAALQGHFRAHDLESHYQILNKNILKYAKLLVKRYGQRDLNSKAAKKLDALIRASGEISQAVTLYQYLLSLVQLCRDYQKIVASHLTRIRSIEDGEYLQISIENLSDVQDTIFRVLMDIRSHMESFTIRDTSTIMTNFKKLQSEMEKEISSKAAIISYVAHEESKPLWMSDHLAEVGEAVKLAEGQFTRVQYIAYEFSGTKRIFYIYFFRS